MVGAVVAAESRAADLRKERRVVFMRMEVILAP
jgi:hypothetical protein